VAEIESKDNTSKDKLGDAFKALLADTSEEEEQHSDSYFTSIEVLLTKSLVPYIIVPYVENLASNLNNQALIHRLTTRLPSEPKDILKNDLIDNFTTRNTSRYNSHHFYKVVINTGASKYSTAGYRQFQALQRTNSITLNKTTKGQVTVQFSIGSTSSIRSTTVKTPIKQVEFHIIHTKTPFLLSLADMDKLGVYFNNLTNSLVTSTRSILVIRRFGHSFLL
jgi:hypothetical protein